MDDYVGGWLVGDPERPSARVFTRDDIDRTPTDGGSAAVYARRGDITDERRSSILEALNAYSGTSVWPDVIAPLPEYSPEITAWTGALLSDHVGLVDGSVIRFDPELRVWAFIA